MMHGVFTLLLAHVLASLGQYAHGSEIIHGRKVPDDMMPYMVSLQKNNVHVCGGFLISEEFVLTAAHCNKSTHVVLGNHNLKKVDNNARKQIVMKCNHSSYKEPGRGHDIMLLKLSQKVSLNNRVNLVRLSENQKLKDNQKCRVAGWGFTRTGGKVVDELQVVDVTIINRKVCDKEWQKNGDTKLPKNVICAGGYGKDSGFCQGDSGGPLVCGGMAVGIVSFNFRKNCTYPNLPNIYTDISKYIDWIKKTLKKKQCVNVTQ